MAGIQWVLQRFRVSSGCEVLVEIADEVIAAKEPSCLLTNHTRELSLTSVGLFPLRKYAINSRNFFLFFFFCEAFANTEMRILELIPSSYFHIMG